VVVPVADRLALAALVHVLPAATVDDVLCACDQAAERVRALPPWVTTYHVLGSAMCPSATYDEVTELLWSTLPAATGRGLSRQSPTTGAVTRARSRLGVQPLAILLTRLVDAVAQERGNDAIYLHRFAEGEMPPLWWTSDVGTAGVRGCDLRGDDIDAAVDLVRASAADRVILCAPGTDEFSLRDRLAPEVSVESGRLPGWVDIPWLGLRARTHRGWKQGALARACISVAVEAALRNSGIGR
jgi:hypothetical protein